MVYGVFVDIENGGKKLLVCFYLYTPQVIHKQGTFAAVSFVERFGIAV
jgi:hypothetical protein